jgi:alkyl hydroperoxide reductase subunit D
MNMGMNSVYYHFLHLASTENYCLLAARLGMNAIRNHGIDPVAFETWSASVSPINGFAVCEDSHGKAVPGKGPIEAAVLPAVGLPAAVHGVATVLDAEKVSSAAPNERLIP